MNRNAEAITIFCSHLCISNDIHPLEPKEWSDFAVKLDAHHLQPGDLLDFASTDFIETLSFTSEEATRFMRLIDRSGSLGFEINKYESMGIQIITRADKEYPQQLRKKLKNSRPPLFYYAGDLDLLNRPCVGYVGSRNIDKPDIDFTEKTVAKTSSHGYSVVSGGAKGIDSISAIAAMNEGVAVIEYIADSMLRKMRDSALTSKIRDGCVLLMSAVVPSAGFNVGTAMMRNRYIYAQSEGTVVIRSDKGKGGTWAGATDNLKNKWCPTFCRDCDYPGNRDLILRGAIPITDSWNGNIAEMCEQFRSSQAMTKPEETIKQLSMFD